MKSSPFLACLILLLTTPIVSAQYTVEKVARLKGQESTTIFGYGIVSGLSGTGDDPKSFDPSAQAILRTLELGGMPAKKRISRGREEDPVRSISSSRNNALVRVTVKIPATGAREGEELDCVVTSIGNAKSLKGGYLSVSMLSGPIPAPMELAHTAGMAVGQISLEDPTVPNVGKIKKGCRLLCDFNHPYIKDGCLTLVIHPQFAGTQMANCVSKSLNSDLQRKGYGTRATAINQNYVMVEVPRGRDFSENPMQFVDEVMSVTVKLDRPLVPRVIINEREGTISIDEDVEIRPGLEAHKNMIVDIREPLPAGEIENEPRLFVDLDTATKRAQFEGQPVVNTKLKSLQASLDALRLTQRDMIAVVNALERRGAIIGEVIRVE